MKYYSINVIREKIYIPSELKSTHFFFEKLMKVANEKNVCHIFLLNCLSLSLGKFPRWPTSKFPFMILTENWLLRPHSAFLIWSQSKLCTVLCEFRTWFFGSSLRWCEIIDHLEIIRRPRPRLDLIAVEKCVCFPGALITRKNTLI